MWSSRVIAKALLATLMLFIGAASMALAANDGLPAAASPPGLSAARPRLPFGVVTSTIPPEHAFGRKPRGANIGTVFADSVAARAGLKRYDIILKFGDKNIDTMQDLVEAVRATHRGTVVRILVLRNLRDKLTLTARF